MGISDFSYTNNHISFNDMILAIVQSKHAVDICSGFQLPATYSTHRRLTEMTIHLENQFHEDIRSVIRFLWAKHVSVPEIHRKLVLVYAETAMSHQILTEYRRNFEAGREKVMDPYLSSRSRISTSYMNTTRMEEQRF